MRWCLNLNSLFVRGKLSYSLKLACARLRGIKTLDERKQKDWEAHQVRCGEAMKCALHVELSAALWVTLRITISLV